jgi:hypothetical protein
MQVKMNQNEWSRCFVVRNCQKYWPFSRCCHGHSPHPPDGRDGLFYMMEEVRKWLAMALETGRPENEAAGLGVSGVGWDLGWLVDEGLTSGRHKRMPPKHPPKSMDGNRKP